MVSELSHLVLPHSIMERHLYGREQLLAPVMLAGQLERSRWEYSKISLENVAKSILETLNLPAGNITCFEGQFKLALRAAFC